MKNFIIVICIILGGGKTLKAQTGAGSSTNFNSSMTISSGTTVEEYAETLYIGPNAELEISGELIIYSKYVWIAPTAKITGTGSMIIANPDDNPFYPHMTGATTIDGNNCNPILVTTISHQNPNNIILGDITDPGYGTVNPSGSLAAALPLSGVLSFDVTGGDIFLNGNDLVLVDDGILDNFAIDKCVITGNSIIGHVVKINNGITRATAFPVGIAEGECTLASIQGSGTYYVSVINYTGATAAGVIISRPEEGMDRAWHIYGGAADDMFLLHDIATNGTAYNDATAFITRYLGSGKWSSSAASDYVFDGAHRNSDIIPSGIPASSSANGAWLTKTSDAMTPLPVKLTSFEVYKKEAAAELKWTTTSEQNNKGFDIERSADGVHWTKINFVPSLSINGNSSSRLDYTIIDKKPENGQNYYRLKQVDFDGKAEYSEVRKVWFTSPTIFSVYPNPAQDIIHISGLEGTETIALYDATGKLMQQQKAVASVTALALERLSAGTYYIRITGKDGKTNTHTFVKRSR